MTTPSIAISLRLQDIAQSIDDILSDIAGERCSFVLMVNVGDVTQYVSNTDRADGAAMIEGLLSRRKTGRADIPAHYNPDLADPPDWHPV